jgi:recombinational DNA repair protein (RecF pathway)
MARGVRKPKSKLAGSIELFGDSEITYLPGKGEFKTLISARLENNYENIVLNLDRTNLAYAMMKVINDSVENETGEELYPLLKDSFFYINHPNLNLDIIRLWFGVHFLNLMGHTPNLNITDNSDIKAKYAFDIERMSFIDQERGRYTINHLKILKLSLGNDPATLQRIKGISELTPDLLILVQTLLKKSGFKGI